VHALRTRAHAAWRFARHSPALAHAHRSATTDYVVTVTQAPAPFGILVTRRSTGAVLFDTRVGVSGATPVNGLVFEDQYLEWSTQLPASAADGGVHLFGLAEHITASHNESRLHACARRTLRPRLRHDEIEGPSPPSPPPPPPLRFTLGWAAQAGARR